MHSPIIYPCRCAFAVIITARSVTVALSSSPQSTEAYESARRIVSMIKEAEKITHGGNKKMVSFVVCIRNNYNLTLAQFSLRSIIAMHFLLKTYTPYFCYF